MKRLHDWNRGPRRLPAGFPIEHRLPKDEVEAYLECKRIEKRTREQHDGRFKTVKAMRREKHLVLPSAADLAERARLRLEHRAMLVEHLH